ncbi:MAG: hypothetical protein K1Y01_14150 [Vicinamibacteria bacterium]|nr:hypothetical protein [Vicinamibacteria bacterium]
MAQARATTAADGSYTLEGIREGEDVSVFAWDPDVYRLTSVPFFAEPGVGFVAVPEIGLSPDDWIGSVLVGASIEASGQPASNYAATMELEGWPFSIDLTLDALGEARVAGLPGGSRAIVTVTGAAGFGRESELVVSRAETLVNVPVGDRVGLPAQISPFAFSGGMVSETPNSCAPFCVIPYFETDQGWEPWASGYSASVDASGRNLTVVFRTPVQGNQNSPLKLTRRLYVAPGGEFARIVDVVENVGSASADVRYYLDQYLEPHGTLTEILDGGVSPDDAAFVFQSDQAPSDTAGFVFRGPAGALPFSMDTYPDNQGAYPRWDFALEPGQKVGFMSFAVFERGAGAASVVSRVQALMNLTNPLALQGLSPEDRALILNWILP